MKHILIAAVMACAAFVNVAHAFPTQSDVALLESILERMEANNETLQDIINDIEKENTND